MPILTVTATTAKSIGVSDPDGGQILAIRGNTDGPFKDLNGVALAAGVKQVDISPENLDEVRADLDALVTASVITYTLSAGAGDHPISSMFITLGHADFAAGGSNVADAAAASSLYTFPTAFPKGARLLGAWTNTTEIFDASDAGINSFLVSIGSDNGNDVDSMLTACNVGALGDSSENVGDALTFTATAKNLAMTEISDGTTKATATLTVAGGGSPTVGELTAGAATVHVMYTVVSA